MREDVVAANLASPWPLLPANVAATAVLAVVALALWAVYNRRKGKSARKIQNGGK